ncbi:uncharacterized protein SPPG_08864 [Spizellomyces punctatus DAOM BR117]|uniref:Uncharacterized protein n=1 Tax=Spizellomyces punctatus (strain DAOM BR117) TaxID=645134 RepID=A0A0L0HV58_SPIPD|nr:uncharacterized protein SPPG_08864 [Spizellomyces punctatus DAOM BR117]KND04977.1 hypothetical protein SPPG_08864 [Spizellomyces punctatus DAOM BR117]|eukprot:XP_016613016.1 hypothetical protein SPPG_08864 [Spizellomyces punctatus DAOM BR117]
MWSLDWYGGLSKRHLTALIISGCTHVTFPSNLHLQENIGVRVYPVVAHTCICGMATVQRSSGLPTLQGQCRRGYAWLFVRASHRQSVLPGSYPVSRHNRLFDV